jgi:excisionase family DNA binding protein
MALLTVKNMSAWFQVKPATVYGWVAEGKIPALRLGGLIRFRRDDIEAWLEECQIEKPNTSRPADRRLRSSDIDAIIASAKRAAYTPSHGTLEQDRATRKGEYRGTV